MPVHQRAPTGYQLYRPLGGAATARARSDASSTTGCNPRRCVGGGESGRLPAPDHGESDVGLRALTVEGARSRLGAYGCEQLPGAIAAGL